MSSFMSLSVPEAEKPRLDELVAVLEQGAGQG